MFAVQINFSDKSNPSDPILLPRSSATIGTSAHNHLVIEGIKDLGVEVSIVRGLGSRFFVKIISTKKVTDQLVSEKEYLSFADLVIGELEIFIYSFDPLIFSEKTEITNIELLQNIYYSSDSLFPALQVVSRPRVGFTLSDLNNFKIGRSNKCQLRLEGDVDSEHVELSRLNNEWYLAPIVRTPTVFLNGSVVSSSTMLRSRDRIRIGANEIIYLDSLNDFNEFSDEIGYNISSSVDSGGYILSVVKGLASPASIPLRVGGTYTIGRDPSHSIWIDAPFVSRLHFTISILSDGFEITDFSSNGTIISEEKLISGRPTFVDIEQADIVLGPELTLRIVRQVTDYKLLPDSMVIENLDEDIVGSEDEENYFDSQEFNLRSSSEANLSALSARQEFSERSFIDVGSKERVEDFYDSEPRGEFPIRVGLERFSTQIFVTMLLLVLLAVIVIVAKNIIF